VVGLGRPGGLHGVAQTLDLLRAAPAAFLERHGTVAALAGDIPSFDHV